MNIDLAVLKRLAVLQMYEEEFTEEMLEYSNLQSPNCIRRVVNALLLTMMDEEFIPQNNVVLSVTNADINDLSCEDEVRKQFFSNLQKEYGITVESISGYDFLEAESDGEGILPQDEATELFCRYGLDEYFCEELEIDDDSIDPPLLSLHSGWTDDAAIHLITITDEAKPVVDVEQFRKDPNLCLHKVDENTFSIVDYPRVDTSGYGAFTTYKTEADKYMPLDVAVAIVTHFEKIR